MNTVNEENRLRIEQNLKEIIELHKQWYESNGHSGLQLIIKNSMLSGVDFEGSSLNQANMRNTDLSGADFKGSYLRTADLEEAKLPILPKRGYQIR